MSGASVERRHRNEQLLRRLGLHAALFDALLGPQSVPHRLAVSPKRMFEQFGGLLRECIELLTRLCVDKDNQRALTPYAADIQASYFGRHVGAEALLGAIYSDNRAAALAVNTELVQGFVERAVWQLGGGKANRGANGADGSGAVSCLRFLKSVVLSEGEWLSANQELVFRSLVSFKRRAAFDEGFWRDGANRLDLASLAAAVDAGQLASDESRLRYHIDLMHLLAHCVTDSTARKMRNMLPLGMLAGPGTLLAATDLNMFNSVDSEETAAAAGRCSWPCELVEAHLHLVVALYITPLGLSPSLAAELYMQPLQPTGSGPAPTHPLLALRHVVLVAYTARHATPRRLPALRHAAGHATWCHPCLAAPLAHSTPF